MSEKNPLLNWIIVHFFWYLCHFMHCYRITEERKGPAPAKLDWQDVGFALQSLYEPFLLLGMSCGPEFLFTVFGWYTSMTWVAGPFLSPLSFFFLEIHTNCPQPLSYYCGCVCYSARTRKQTFNEKYISPSFDFIRQDNNELLVFLGYTYPDPSEVHGLSDELVILRYFLLRGKLHKAFTDLSSQPENTTHNLLLSRSILVQLCLCHFSSFCCFISIFFLRDFFKHLIWLCN